MAQVGFVVASQRQDTSQGAAQLNAQLAVLGDQPDLVDQRADDAESLVPRASIGQCRVQGSDPLAGGGI